MVAPLGDDDEPNYLQEGAAAAVRAAESLSRGLSQNVQWGIDAAAGHLAGVGRPKPSPLRSPPPSPPAESPGTRSILRQSSSRVSSDAGPSVSPGEHQSPSSDARATASAEVPTKQQVVTTPYYTLTAPLLPSCYPFLLYPYTTLLAPYCPLTSP